MMRQPDLGVGADVASDGLDGIRFSRGMVVGLLLRDRGEIRWRGGADPAVCEEAAAAWGKSWPW